MQSRLKLLLVVLVVGLLVGSCQLKLGHSGIDEGSIRYKINYLQSEKENPIIGLMPGYLTMQFKNNSVRMDVEGWMGVFKSTFIRQYEQQKSVNLLKMMSKRYYYTCTETTQFMGMDTYHSVDVAFDNEVRDILNFKCKHARVSVNNGAETFSVYYTRQIAIKEPNAQTPYFEIPGVLMAFQIEVNGIAMYLEAVEVLEREIPDAVFEIPEGFEEVPKASIDEIFSALK
ncbi:MAG: hypothetical protein AB7S69_11585 [Salinivirgaceae bacterium]